ncbi:MAG: family 16 glycosylhydrolase [Anaerolineales bacterium]|nr:family 16 glycosylhydrolase [Anaerolineales bacterium]
MPLSDPPTMKTLTAGGGEVTALENDTHALQIEAIPRGYAVAQLDDYHHLARRDLKWRPPLHLRLQARTSIREPSGTLGFGFWNDPFSLSMGLAGTARRVPASPQTLWFFYGSPPNDMALAPPVPGHGWKAAVLRAASIPAWVLAPAALAAFCAARIPLIRRLVMKAAIGTVRADEALIDVSLSDFHQYELVWQRDAVQFLVDGRLILESSVTPRAPLGFVAWIDNQYAVASPEGGFRFGVIPTDQPQTLLISDLRIDGELLTLAPAGDA